MFMYFVLEEVNSFLTFKRKHYEKKQLVFTNKSVTFKQNKEENWKILRFEPRHEISNNLVCATSKV